MQIEQYKYLFKPRTLYKKYDTFLTLESNIQECKKRFLNQ